MQGVHKYIIIMRVETEQEEEMKEGESLKAIDSRGQNDSRIKPWNQRARWKRCHYIVHLLLFTCENTQLRGPDAARNPQLICKTKFLK